MADFVRKKLQIFVSSTYEDLKVERQAAVSAILSAGHIPAGMELFTAGDESQMEVIKQWIDESDVFVLILGGRYGSIEPTSGKSYTHLEYDYALSTNKPLFACVIDDKAIDPRVRREGAAFIETANGGKLADFLVLVLSKLCKLWEDSKDIKIAITETLAHIARRDDLVGWVRPTAQTNLAALVNELARLSQENASLRSVASSNHAVMHFNGLSFSELKALLEKSGAIKSLIVNREELVLGHYRDRTQDPNIAELTMRGLLRSDGAYYLLTEEGRSFLNKYDYELFKINPG